MNETRRRESKAVAELVTGHRLEEAGSEAGRVYGDMTSAEGAEERRASFESALRDGTRLRNVGIVAVCVALATGPAGRRARW